MPVLQRSKTPCLKYKKKSRLQLEERKKIEKLWEIVRDLQEIRAAREQVEKQEEAV